MTRARLLPNILCCKGTWNRCSQATRHLLYTFAQYPSDAKAHRKTCSGVLKNTLAAQKMLFGSMQFAAI